ncbi:DUF6479 family protein [Streptomyces megasporus]|uniref:DUF6479 family protein n=1 Tax=Streptomyces megasporus TaxID=44060 RepID=UPI0004E14B03|nr:DUF6479 family protein [Streptomyces megasporus]
MNGTYAYVADHTPLAASDLLIGLGPFLAGIVVAAVLILAVLFGLRLLNRGDEGISTPNPRPERPRGYEEGVRDDESLPVDGRRRYPHELQEHEDTHPVGPDDRRRWSPGSSGGFGSGGPGRT